MASISSLMGGSSSTSSIYGSRTNNIISGLASGLDTEAMIEGLVQGYQQKISKLQQENTTLQWQQEAYQSISDKLVEFARKYTSYTSPSTNLFSNSFFNNAVLTSTGGTYADLVSASGKSTSDVVINAVAQLATAARITSSGVGIDHSISSDGGKITVTGGDVDLTGDMNVSTMSGTLTLSYGNNQEVTIRFDELELYNKDDGTLDTDALQESIQKKLEEQELVVGNTTYKASDLINVTVGSDGKVSLSDANGYGNKVAITGATGNFKGLITDASTAIDNQAASFQLDTTKDVTKTQTKAEYLSGKTFSVSYNGQTTSITLGQVTDNASMETMLQEAMEKAFGDGKVTVAQTPQGAFSFTVNEGDVFSFGSDSVGEVLFGEGNQGLSSYVNTSKTLEQLMGTDSSGNLVFGNQSLKPDTDGKYTLTVNDATFTYTKDTTLQTILDDINNSEEAGVSVTYSQLSNQFVFTARETGSGHGVELSGGLATIFGGERSAEGKDAIFQATINDVSMTLTRSSNTFDLDGMSVTLGGTFNVKEGFTGDITTSNAVGDTGWYDDSGEAVTFSSKMDADAIVDVVKQMVEDYNEILTEVKNAYTTQPLKQSDGRTGYEPLTDEDKEGMTDSEIERYEEKAKTGLLYMDSDLSSLYNMLRSAITPGGADGQTLRSIGINTSYSDGLTTISLDEQALREALDTNPDQVRDIFTKSQENGSATNGLMASIKQATDRYAATEGAVKGILIEKAGSQFSPSKALDNTLLNKMNEISEQISKWQDKMSDRVDYYTNKFTQLELLIQQMNSQSASLSGLMGGY